MGFRPDGLGGVNITWRGQQVHYTKSCAGRDHVTPQFVDECLSSAIFLTPFISFHRTCNDLCTISAIQLYPHPETKAQDLTRSVSSCNHCTHRCPYVTFRESNTVRNCAHRYAVTTINELTNNVSICTSKGRKLIIESHQVVMPLTQANVQKTQPWKAVWPPKSAPDTFKEKFGFEKGDTMLNDGNAAGFRDRKEWTVYQESRKIDEKEPA